MLELALICLFRKVNRIAHAQAVASVPVPTQPVQTPVEAYYKARPCTLPDCKYSGKFNHEHIPIVKR
jgi:hypothetical protein